MTDVSVGFWLPRLQNSRIFCERERRTIFERKVWSEWKNGEGEWWETLKNRAVRHAYIKFVQNYPFFQQREIPIGLILTQSVIKCQSHFIKMICISFTGKPRGKMNDVDLGFVLQVEQKEDVESLLRGNMFLMCCLQTLEKAWYFSCLFWRKTELPARQILQ